MRSVVEEKLAHFTVVGPAGLPPDLSQPDWRHGSIIDADGSIPSADLRPHLAA
jgi:hypothetical protein